MGLELYPRAQTQTRIRARRVWYPRVRGYFVPVAIPMEMVVSRGLSGVEFVSTSQSDWTVLSLGDVCVACVDVPIRLACGVVFGAC